MLTENVQLGQFVRSVAGRDKGKYYLIYDVLNEAFVRIIDGEKKRINNPKKKNIKHLEFFPQKADDIAEMIRKGETVSEQEVLRIIKSLG